MKMRNKKPYKIVNRSKHKKISQKYKKNILLLYEIKTIFIS